MSKRTLTVTWTSLAIGATAGALTTLGSYVQREIRHRGYPTWEQCHCDFKSRPSIFQVWHGRHEQRGETIIAEEWGTLLRNPPRWVRRLLHHSSQAIATLNPRGNYVERVALSPQESRQLAILLHTTSSEEETTSPSSHVVWKCETLHAPRYLIDVSVRRLYPAHIPPERIATAQPLPALWDPHSNLPLPAEGAVLETPAGTRIDCIGWAPSQVSYCTAQLGNIRAR